MKEYVEGRGKALVTDPERKKDPVAFVTALLELKDKFDVIISRAFSDDKGFVNALNLAFELFINMESRAPEYLSLFIDEKLKKGLKGKTEDEVEVMLDKVMILFRYLQDRD